MLSAIRTFLDTKYAKVFFVVLVVPFVLWGIAGVANNSGGGSTAVATVGDQTVEAIDFQQAYRQLLAQATRQMGTAADPAPEIKRSVGGQALDRLITQAAIAEEVRRLGLAAPDEAVRQAVFDIPAFKGRAGTYDRATMEGVLRQNNLTVERFLQLMRSDIGQRQLMEAVQVGARSSNELLNQVFAFQRENRVAMLVELPFSAAAAPAMPTDADLMRAYEDDPQRYSAPAFRRIKAVVLSPDTIARGAEVAEPDIAAYYDAHRSLFGTPEKRSLDVVVVQDAAAAAKLEALWKGGADWAAVQKAASEAGASSVSIDDSLQSDIPAPDLAEAAFKAAPDVVTGPVQSAFGLQLFRVTKVTPGTQQPLAAVRDQVRQKVARDRAVDEVYGRANRLEDALSAGTALDDLPGDLGVAGVAGTLDDKGNTPDGEPAPIPGSPALRQAIIAKAFATAKGAAPTMLEGPEQSYYALQVEDETPPAVKPFDAVKAQVADNWEADARKKEQEIVAAKLLAAVNAGQSLADAATVAGVRAEPTRPILRGQPTEGVPPALVQPAFGLKLKQATMIETPDGFLVAQVTGIASPDPATDPAGAAQMRTALDRSIGQDIETTFALALRERAKPTVNQTLMESLVQ